MARHAYLDPDQGVIDRFEAQLAGRSDEQLRETIDANGRLYNTVFEQAAAALDFSKVEALGGTDDEKRDKLSETIAERKAAANLLDARERKAEADAENNEALEAIRRRGPRTFTAQQVADIVRNRPGQNRDAANLESFIGNVRTAAQAHADTPEAPVTQDAFRRMFNARAGFDTGLEPRTLLRDPVAAISAGDVLQTGTGVTTAQVNTGFLTLPPLQQDVEYLSRRMTSVFAFLAARAMELPMNAQGQYRYTAETAPQGNKPAARAQANALAQRKYATEMRIVPLAIMGQWVPVAVEEFLDVPMFQDFLSTVMREDLLLEVDNQLINGTGVAPNIEGLLDNIPQSNTNDQGAGTQDAPTFGLTELHADIWKEVYGIGNAYADVILMHPNNWHEAVTQRDSQDRFLVGNTVDQVRQTLFGLPVIKNTAIPEDTVATFASNKFRMITQGGVRVDTTNSHDDGFSNLVDAVRMYVRLGLMKRRTTAIAATTMWGVKKTG